MPLLDNERVTVWDYTRPRPATKHSHPMDTFVVWTEGRAGHAVFLPAGTVHTDEPIGSASQGDDLRAQVVRGMTGCKAG